MQYRLAGEWPETPDVYRPRSGNRLGSMSAVELPDSRILVVWVESTEALNTSRFMWLRTGYATNAVTFFTGDNTVTLDRTLITGPSGVIGNGREMGARIFNDPVYGVDRIWLSLWGGSQQSWVYDATFEPAVGGDIFSGLWSSMDYGATWEQKTVIWSIASAPSTAVFADNNRRSISQFEFVGAGASYVDPYPGVTAAPVGDAGYPSPYPIAGSKGELLHVHPQYNTRPSAAPYMQCPATLILPDGPIASGPGVGPVDPPMIYAAPPNDYWGPYTLPTVFPDDGWLDRQSLPSDLASVDVGAGFDLGGAVRTESSNTIISHTHGGGSTGRRAFWMYYRAFVGLWKPLENITTPADAANMNVSTLSTTIGSMFTIYGEPAIVYHFTERIDPTAFVLRSTSTSTPGFPGPLEEDMDYIAGTGATGVGVKIIWSDLTTTNVSNILPSFVQRVGDYLGFFWGGNIIGVRLDTPRVHALPPLHIPHKSWFEETSARTRQRHYADNWKRLEGWCALVRRGGNTLDLINLPRVKASSPPFQHERRWLTLERWSRTLANNVPLHVPHKRDPLRDDVNWLAVERWVRGVPSSDAPF